MFRQSVRLAALFCLLVASTGLAVAAQVATSTALTVSAGGASVTTVTSETAVTLTAKVTTTSGVSAAPGQVLFCDDAAANCALHPVGLSQTVAGTGSATATYTFLPSPSTHSYSARFLANANFAASTSASQSLNVTSSNSTATTLASTLANKLYTLTAQVTSQGTPLPTGTVNFTDTANGVVLGSGAITGPASSYSLKNAAQPFTGDNGACTVVIADFNRDGIPDVATGVGCVSPNGSNSANALQILLGKGDGTFTVTTPPTGFAKTNVLALATGDFNNDGVTDLITTTATSTTVPGSNLNYTYAFSFVAGNGDGTFAAPIRLGSSCNNSHIVTGDFNNDGNQDIAVDCFSGVGTATTVQVLLGLGNGRFTSGSRDAASGASSGVALTSGDVNNDGRIDLIVGGISGDYVTTVLLGKGDGTFAVAGSYTTPNGVTTVLADVNGDGKADLVSLALVAGTPSSSLLATQLGNADGTFAAAVTTAVPASVGYGATTLLHGDFNGDRKRDVAIVTYNSVSLLQGTATGRFEALVTLSLPATSAPNNFPAAIADFDGDGVPDTFASSSDGTTGLSLLTTASTSSTAQITTSSPVGSGTHAVTASYSGDSYTTASTSAAVNLTASPAVTALTLAAAPAQVSLGAQVLLTASLSPYDAGTLTTDGESITFFSNGKTVGTANLRTGAASISLTTLPLGANSITATYLGDSSFGASISSAITVMVAAPSTPTLSPTSLSFAAQAMSTISAVQTVSLINTAAGPLAITSITATGDFSQTNGCGSSLAVGASCTIAVTFTPTASGARSGTLTVTDNAAVATQAVALTGTGAVPFTAASGSSSLTLARGSSGQSTIQFQAATGYAGTISLSCAVAYQGTGTAAYGPTCTVSPASVTITSGGMAASTLTVSTTAAVASITPLERGAGIAIAGLCLMIGLPPRSRVRSILLAVLCTLAWGFVSGCGGSSDSSKSSSGTTSGSYTVTVTAVAGATSASILVPLTVQ